MDALPATADPAAELAALRERATSLGAHLHMPDSILKPWVHFKTAPLPILQFNGDGIFVAPAAANVAYAGYFSPVWSPEFPLLRLQCRVGSGCEAKPLSFHVVSAGGVHTFPMANAVAHLKSCPGTPFLTHEHAAARPKGKPSGVAVVAAGSKHGRELSFLEMLNMDEGGYRSILLKSILGDARPLASVESFGTRNFLRALRLPTPSERTMRRLFDVEYKQLVRDPIMSQLNLWTEPFNFAFSGQRYTLKPRLKMSADGWKGGGGHTFESVAVQGYSIDKPVIQKRVPGKMEVTRTVMPAQLRPLHLPLALAHWEVGVHGAAGGGFSANAHSALLLSVIGRFGLLATDFRAIIMDTTAGNPAVLREREWKHAMYLECVQHVEQLVTKDLMAIPSFAQAHNAAHDLSVWLRRSAKRMSALHRFVKLCPLGASNTRFGQHLLMMERISVMWGGLTNMYVHVTANKPLFNGMVKPDDPATVVEFKRLFVALQPHKLVLDALAALCSPFMLTTTYLGSEKAYTSGSLYAVFELLWASADALRRRPERPIADIGLAFQESMLERLATDHMHQTYIKLVPAQVYKMPTWKSPAFDKGEKDLRFQRDTRFYTCMVLDPAASPVPLIA